MQAAPITLSPLGPIGAAQDDVIAMLIEASFDPAIREMNYLPDCMDQEAAREYCRKSDGVVLRVEGQPVGVTVLDRSLHTGDGVEIPPGSVELDEWVLPPFRGKGILGKRGWPLIAAWLAQRFDHAVSLTWEHNHAAMALLLGRGYKRHGRTYFSDSGTEGWCEVFLYDLAPHKTPPQPTRSDETQPPRRTRR